MNVVLGISHLEQAAVRAETKDLGHESESVPANKGPFQIFFLQMNNN
jgi:hypothetical protein